MELAANRLPWLVVGLGNPEAGYLQNRHNLGFRALDALEAKVKVGWGRKFGGDFAQGDLGGVKALLLKPSTFMNRSGEAVAPAAGFFKVPAERVLVLHDELDLPLGRLQLKQGGGHGGHNGLRSIEAALGTREFGRVRLGIGRPPAGWDAADFVLSDFRPDELNAVEVEVQAAVAAVEAVLAQGLQKAMNQQNRRA